MSMPRKVHVNRLVEIQPGQRSVICILGLNALFLTRFFAFLAKIGYFHKYY